MLEAVCKTAHSLTGQRFDSATLRSINIRESPVVPASTVSRDSLAMGRRLSAECPQPRSAEPRVLRAEHGWAAAQKKRWAKVRGA